MRIPDDLHDDDRINRLRLIAALRWTRESRGASLARAGEYFGGVSAAAVHSLEHRTSWSAVTIMRYARVIGFRIEWVISGLDLPDPDGDVMYAVLAAGDTSTPVKADRVHWRRTCYDLTRHRRATISAVAMGARLRLNQNTVHHWEANPDGASVITAQRHARALDGQLGWRLHEVRSPIPMPVPLQRGAA
jgi:hypothetical protein